MELTQEHFDKAVSKLATAEELAEVKDDVKTLRKTVDSHTTSLEKLLTKKKVKEDEELIASDRLKRIEDFCEVAAKQLNIKFEL